MQDFFYETRSYAPSNSLWQLSGNNRVGSASVDDLHQRGTNKASSKEKQEVNPVWVIRKSLVVSEPKYRIPMLRNMDAPWRRQVVESSTREVNQHDAENHPIQGQEADVLGRESNLDNLLEIEESSKSLFGEDPKSKASVNVEVSQESSLPSCEVQEHEDETRLTLLTESSDAVDREGVERQCGNGRDISQSCVSEPLNTQNKSPSKPDSVEKIGNVLGKKKKSKKLSIEAKNK